MEGKELGADNGGGHGGAEKDTEQTPTETSEFSKDDPRPPGNGEGGIQMQVYRVRIEGDLRHTGGREGPRAECIDVQRRAY